VAHNETAVSDAPHFSFAVANGVEDGDELIFSVEWTGGAVTDSFSFHEYVKCPKAAFDSCLIDDGSGDMDGSLDPGEAIALSVVLKNVGSVNGQNLSAQLSCDLPQYITIQNNTAHFGDIPVGGSAQSQAPHFTLFADPAAPNYTWVTFTLNVVGDNYAGEVTFPVEITDCNLRISFPLDGDPQWEMEDAWAFGVPQGKKPPKLGGGCPDPLSGYTGSNVLGYNLLGAYSIGMPARTLTSSALDCSNLSSVKVRFKRWLGVATALNDHAAFQVSTDGIAFHDVWTHTGSTPISDNAWIPVEYDLSAWADGQPTVYLRWVMGPCSYVLVYCGWNIDDIEIWGK
jgi:hypothetical protein